MKKIYCDVKKEQVGLRKCHQPLLSLQIYKNLETLSKIKSSQIETLVHLDFIDELKSLSRKLKKRNNLCQSCKKIQQNSIDWIEKKINYIVQCFADMDKISKIEAFNQINQSLRKMLNYCEENKDLLPPIIFTQQKIEKKIPLVIDLQKPTIQIIDLDVDVEVKDQEIKIIDLQQQ